MVVEQEKTVYDRGTRLAKALGMPELAGYWGQSLGAYTALLYIRWLLDTHTPSWSNSLLCAELNSWVIFGRIINTFTSSLPEKPCRVT